MLTTEIDCLSEFPPVHGFPLALFCWQTESSSFCSWLGNSITYLVCLKRPQTCRFCCPSVNEFLLTSAVCSHEFPWVQWPISSTTLLTDCKQLVISTKVIIVIAVLLYRVAPGALSKRTSSFQLILLGNPQFLITRVLQSCWRHAGRQKFGDIPATKMVF